ncbi:hypothetical protein J4423_00330 [Candidatus Pacearchaeota archaeon]|nr:hypothetical protein [Candidatus Pacearchaeota archaeon]
MKKTCTFIYEDMTDRLFISRKDNSDKIYGSIRILNVILDITTNNEVANIELIDASQYLESLGLDSSILQNLTEVEISFKQIRQGYLIAFILKSGKKAIAVPYNIQMPVNKQIVINQF